MGKQPYIPFYVGDYLKDTRILPLAVRGAWVDLILYMWESPIRGELIGTIDDFARLMSCEKSEAAFALDLLKQKMIADFEFFSKDLIKITSRKMKRDSEISKKRSEAGKNGVDAKKDKQFASAKQQANNKQNTEYEYEVKNDNDLNKNKREEKKDFTKPDINGDELVFPIDTPQMRKLWCAWKESRWNNFGVIYGMHGEQAALQQLDGLNFHQARDTIQQAIASNWKNLYPDKNGQRKNGNDPKSRIDEIIENRFGAG